MRGDTRQHGGRRRISARVACIIACLGAMLAGTARAQLVKPEEKLTVGNEYDVPSGAAVIGRTIKADVVAIDQVIFFNRLMAVQPAGMIYALERDVEPSDGGLLGPGNARLRSDKRPRPLVLRMSVGDCLEVTFTNLLAPERADNDQPLTRSASLHVDGLSLVGSMASSGSNVGANASSLAMPGESRVYKWYASSEGSFVFRSAGALTGGEGNGGQPDFGLFGVVHVEPRGSRWYRSQVTDEELDLATTSIDANGNRRIDFGAVYPMGHRFEGLPILEILRPDNGCFEIVHSDLNAIIADVPAGNYPDVTAAAPDNNGVDRHRDEPFREFTICYHDEQGLVQAFPVLETEFFAHSVRDNMAINYGTGGVGAELLSYGADEIQGASPRTPAGNAARCNDCKYEEAFLSSWTVGDPAMVFERTPAMPAATGDALEARYPDDPSNVHHSYLGDHVKMRVVHAGVKEHHIHHLHAHQWLQTQNGDNSTYFDSQAIGPGSSFTLDIAYNGSGNRNKTIGDSIFHCHFYPHFAQGMWSLWRVHDVFEDGTRKLPDAELAGGTPIPALVPMPWSAMPPPPTVLMPGYPFYIPGVAGHRPPHPPLDTVHDGGLPRHVVEGGKVLDGMRGAFDRIAVEMDATELPEDGTDLEKSAMAFHAMRTHATVTPEGMPATLITNGQPGVAGAPYADPCVDDDGAPVGTPRTIKAAVHQLDAIINKAGWHFPQTRMLSLWGDVAAFQSGARAPEPMFVRAHSGDCITYWHTNLLPSTFQEDDFQVFTPTDVVGQHIHLVKFDVTSSDGAANGWNYEDGTFAAEEVIERIEAINEVGGLLQADGSRKWLAPVAHPYFGLLGAQTTVQRWYADPLLNASGEDRTIRTVYTHDHFSPSTHQQAGLYAGLLIEPAGSTWRDPETGVFFGNRDLGGGFGPDGGPTSWRADILTAERVDNHREFMLESQDFHLAYTKDGKPVNPPGRNELPLPDLIEPPAVPMPEAISADDVGTMTLNYRNEPIALRVRDPATNGQASGGAGDLAYAYRSTVARADSDFNSQPNFYPPLTNDVRPGDPFTPLMRAYEGDKVHVRFLVGAQEEGHDFSIHGVRWRNEISDENSVYRNAQMNGISEHFEFFLGKLPLVKSGTQADFLYMPGAAVDDQWNGMWGLLREYVGTRSDLLPLPNNTDGRLPRNRLASALDATSYCPRTAPLRSYDVSAVRAWDVFDDRTLVYNQGHGLNDPTALMYVLSSDLVGGKMKSGAPVEPLVLRANAGDCIKVLLRNRFRADPRDENGFNLFPMIVEGFNANRVVPSTKVGLHPQLVSFDVASSNGVTVGYNPVSTVPRGGTNTFYWYAGTILVKNDGTVETTPVEFGATNLIPGDLLKHSNKGLVGALIIEPQGSTWTFPDSSTRAMADVWHPGGRFREFVTVFQNDVNLRMPDGSPVPIPGGGTVAVPKIEDAEDSGNKAINYRTEPMWTRLGYEPGLDFTGGHAGAGATNDIDFTNALSIAGTGPIETPIFTAPAGMPVRFRVLLPQGHARNHVFGVHGHQWRRDPRNPMADSAAAQAGHGPSEHWDFVPLHGAGGAFGVPGDYIYRDMASFGLDAGMWGVFRVTDD